jgi:hypothetical protein
MLKSWIKNPCYLAHHCKSVLLTIKFETRIRRLGDFSDLKVVGKNPCCLGHHCKPVLLTIKFKIRVRRIRRFLRFEIHG